MIVLESTYDGAGTIVENITLAGTVGDGACVTYDSGYKKTGETARPDYVLLKGGDATDVVPAIPVRGADQLWLADYTALPTVGDSVKLDDTYAANVTGTTGGKAVVVSVDTVKEKARIRFL